MCHVPSTLHAPYICFMHITLTLYAPNMSYVPHMSQSFIHPPCSLLCVMNLQIFLHPALLSFFPLLSSPSWLEHVSLSCVTQVCTWRMRWEVWIIERLHRRTLVISIYTCSHLCLWCWCSPAHLFYRNYSRKNFLKWKKVLIPELGLLSKGPYLVPTENPSSLNTFSMYHVLYVKTSAS